MTCAAKASIATQKSSKQLSGDDRVLQLSIHATNVFQPGSVAQNTGQVGVNGLANLVHNSSLEPFDRETCFGFSKAKPKPHKVLQVHHAIAR